VSEIRGQGDDLINVMGWDIGGANVKAAWMEMRNDRVDHVRVASLPFEIWREKDQLPGVLRAAFAETARTESPHAMAITMTAELSDIFATKREGVLSVLENIQNCFPDVAGYALNLSGEFVALSDARLRPLEFAAANWLASALYVARYVPNCLLIDVGGTTTDILPILNGKVCVSERTDMARLASGELVFTGALRTNLAAIVQSVPVAGKLCSVASEYFAISGDVHLILGYLSTKDYTCTTPDGQPPSLDSARARLARLVCADMEMLSAAEIDELARYIHERQIYRIREGLHQVISRFPELRDYPAIVLGTGAFLGKEAAGGIGLKIGCLANDWIRGELSPCLAAAYLLGEHLKEKMR
jgi:(4-(4-[2-(gamma-L-glutamylamino)ethyl]phenoxymethyl)furan-2-yl)methanamine synthase